MMCAVHQEELKKIEKEKEKETKGTEDKELQQVPSELKLRDLSVVL